MKTVDWMDLVDNFENINCAYHALISLLSFSARELTDNENYGIFVINNHIYDMFKSTLNRAQELYKSNE